ncbi:MAG TPA: hypothetical protein VH207_07030 [Chthoniobacterales bacterium]|jgi:hypothetical protein|nr:hypothetical protein [Chthoniobacterales bacterium]
MNTKQDFWRLLGDYERLSTDEGVALRDVNLAALARLKDQKAVVAEAVLELAAEGGLSIPTARYQNLITKQNENLAITQEQLARMSCEQQNLANASQRLGHVRRAYKQESGQASATLAKG